MRSASDDRSARPLVIVGWDGATPELIQPWVADGTLPNLAAVAQRGCLAPLRSLIHPLSPAAWTSAFTGLNPGRHGIWDFGHRAPGTYRIDHTDASQRHGATLWDIAGECGLRSVVVNVPISHPSGPIEGVFVPGVGAAELTGATWPRDLAGQIEREVPAYRIDSNAYEHTDPADFLKAVGGMVEARTTVAERLLERERPDLMVCVYVATDRVQHAFWRQAQLPGSADDRSGWRFASSIRDCYRQLDAALGRLVEAAGPDATFMVISDHGFGDLEGDLYLSWVLEEMGLLAVRRPPDGLSGRLGRLRSRLSGVRSAPGKPSDPSPTFGDIIWEETRAYSRGLFGCIWLNLKGREPVGRVEPGEEAEQLLVAITERCHSLVGPSDGKPLIEAVHRGADLYEGPLATDAPDLVVVPRDYRWMTRSGCEIGPRGVLTAEAAVRHSGNHRMDGILVAGGPGVAPGADSSRRRLLDVTPTALALLGIEVPRGLDGRPMEGLLEGPIEWTEELPWREPTQASAAIDPDRLVAQLEGLGYLAPKR